jgi:hypothetical protein
MKIIALSALTILMIIGINLRQREIRDEEYYILPSHYKGVVIILYNQKNGQPIKYEQGKRVYEVPQDGILRTQFTHSAGWLNLDEFFYLEDGKKIKIPYVIDGKDIRSDRVQVCCFSSGKAGKDPNSMSIEFAQFYVGTKEEIDSAIDKGENINPADLIK